LKTNLLKKAKPQKMSTNENNSETKHQIADESDIRGRIELPQTKKSTSGQILAAI
jgi:hypothetical protein